MRALFKRVRSSPPCRDTRSRASASRHTPAPLLRFKGQKARLSRTAVMFAQGIQPHNVWSRGSCDPSRRVSCRSRLRPHRLRAAGSVPGVPVAVRQEAAILGRRERRRAPSGSGVRLHGLLEPMRPCRLSASRAGAFIPQFSTFAHSSMTVTTVRFGSKRSNGDRVRRSAPREPGAGCRPVAAGA